MIITTELLPLKKNIMLKRKLDDLNRLSVEEFKLQKKIPLVIILDNVRSALNVGSAFRTADAFAVSELVLCGISATPPHREILKTAIGAEQSVEWKYFEETTSAIESYRKNNYEIWSIEQTEGSVMLQEFNMKGENKIALVFGNEVDGVSDEVLALSDGSIEIPQFGTKHSLNISVSLGIVVWELFKKFKSQL
jgi:tRNA G18 (ribose-2'-O)-methylase SpoU